MTNGDNIDDLCTTTNKPRAGIFSTTSAFCSISMAVNESIDDAFTILGQARASIFLTTFAFKTVTYKKQTGRKAEAYVLQDKKMKNSHNEDKIAVSFYYPFNNSADYALALWFQNIGCTKRDVDSFFKAKLLKPFRIGLQF